MSEVGHSSLMGTPTGNLGGINKKQALDASELNQPLPITSGVTF